MYDVLIIFAVIIGGLGGFVVLYTAWIYLLAKLSNVPFKEALKWWD